MTETIEHAPRRLSDIAIITIGCLATLIGTMIVNELSDLKGEVAGYREEVEKVKEDQIQLMRLLVENTAKTNVTLDRILDTQKNTNQWQGAISGVVSNINTNLAEQRAINAQQDKDIRHITNTLTGAK